ncbi:MAG: uroporphyrinogen-III C-methyltransferase [Alphaproteobacteria bacterium]|nr:uroporphyrinogen-III C-methyltransferase [Alphaproteobacteria bacterium]
MITIPASLLCPPPPSKPYIYILGAGPGDPLLLSIKALQILTQHAQIVVHDRLISPEILALIPDHVEKIFAGKEAEHHYMPQDEIHQTLLYHANQHKIIVRLKGGDPFMFGRGGEEMLFLLEHHIPFEVIPGITAAEGCSAMYGIPLTHRGVAQGVRFITGHQQEGRLHHLDWQGLADPTTTLVIYMGLAHLEQISNQLIAHGLPATTPVAVIRNGTLPDSEIFYSTLSAVAEAVKCQQIKAPCLIIVGKVVALKN